MDFIRYKNIFLGASLILVIVSLYFIFVFGFREGIDFSGGTLWRFSVGAQDVDEAFIKNIFEKELDVPNVLVKAGEEEGDFLVRLPVLDEAARVKQTEYLKKRFPAFLELGVQSIGPSVGEELRSRAKWAIVLVLVVISIYIAIAFRKVSRPVASWKYGVVTLITLFHDVAIPAGLLAILSRYAIVEIDTNFVVALLVVMGFSVHDTIVVFDRIRENLARSSREQNFGEVVNRSINQTIARSLNTSITLILVLISLLFLGPSSLYYFMLTLLVGVVAGIYSSIFVASPLVYVWAEFSRKRRK